MKIDLEIIEDWLEPRAVAQLHTPFTGGELNPKYCVLHAHGSYRTVDRAIGDWTLGGDTKESMHMLVRQDGSYLQMASFKTKVWHCGASYYQGHHGLNNWSIGVCLEEEDGGYYSSEQYEFLDDFLPLLVQTYNIRDIVGHMEVSEDQSDPGHGFPLDRYRPFTRYGNADSLGRYAVSIPSGLSVSDPKSRLKLNVRGGPDVRYEVIDQLNAGDAVKVIRKRTTNGEEDWFQVVYDDRNTSSNRHGWVQESFLRRL